MTCTNNTPAAASSHSVKACIKFDFVLVYVFVMITKFKITVIQDFLLKMILGIFSIAVHSFLQISVTSHSAFLFIIHLLVPYLHNTVPLFRNQKFYHQLFLIKNL